MSTESRNYEVMSFNYNFRKKNWDQQLTPFEVKVWKAQQDRYDSQINNGKIPTIEEEEIMNSFVVGRFTVINQRIHLVTDWHKKIYKF